MGAGEVENILCKIDNLKGSIYNNDAVRKLKYYLMELTDYVTLITYAYDGDVEGFKIFYNDEAIELMCIHFKYDMSIKEMDKEYYFLMAEDFIKNNGMLLVYFKENMWVINDVYFKSIE